MKQGIYREKKEDKNMKNLFPQFSLPSKTTGYSEHPSTNRVKAKSLRATSVWSLYTDEHTESPLSCERTRDRKKERKARKRHFSRRLFSPMIRFFSFVVDSSISLASSLFSLLPLSASCRRIQRCLYTAAETVMGRRICQILTWDLGASPLDGSGSTETAAAAASCWQ